MSVGWIGGIAGAIIGLIGGIIGTYFSIKNTNSRRERALMVKASALFWVAGSIFLVLLFVLSSPYRFLLWIPYSILFPLGIISVNRAQQRIRSEESKGQ